MRRYLVIVTVVVVLAAMVVPLCQCSTPEHDGQNRAAIIDQLYLIEANPEFIAEAKALLESGGFAVDVWQGKEITVDFYKELARYGYQLILLRVHSGRLLAMEETGIKPLASTYLFTGETYTTTRYVSEQLTDKVANALMSEDYPLVFAVSSEFIEDAKGDYDGAVIVAMGCESQSDDDMAAAFVKKDASAYIGWSTVVSLEYVDEVTLDLLHNLCSANMTLARGIDATMAGLGHDPYFDAYLKYYPAESGDKKISELIK